MKPDIIVSSNDLERLEGLLHGASARSRADLDALRDELARADVRDAEDLPDNVITMGSRVRFREELSGKEYVLTLVYPHEAGQDAGNKVSVFSPAGSALLGLSTGQAIDWRTPDGNAIRIQVIEVEQPADAA
ncbi:nucleoside diphosphate kinase regulator [Pseudothauera nasutitermitis]|uniref:Nucleoside diphosphate kinase regulator n=1 Tax=Pseudothauera nasutitermitis TaxID=2565930 RepID=A0A4S4AV91_9RHOO|nr:nucleoside diphosphate kinase regulator [Pseudothauera nasutitermitis]THF63744.1 nucleoside diphosphate kinase regulator [Pseudothauera nasutitermitis]